MRREFGSRVADLCTWRDVFGAISTLKVGAPAQDHLAGSRQMPRLPRAPDVDPAWGAVHDRALGVVLLAYKFNQSTKNPKVNHGPYRLFRPSPRKRPHPRNPGQEPQ